MGMVLLKYHGHVLLCLLDAYFIYSNVKLCISIRTVYNKVHSGLSHYVLLYGLVRYQVGMSDINSRVSVKFISEHFPNIFFLETVRYAKRVLIVMSLFRIPCQ